MLERVSAGNGLKDHNGFPLTVLPRGHILGERYKIETFHKLGGMSITYRARCGDKDVLIKEVSSTDSRAVISLNQERCTLERLHHPGIVKSHDLFEDSGHYYLVLDFVEGQSLDTLISPFPDTFLSEAVVLNWALQLCDIFEYLHGQRPPVIYRDLKPKNVIKNREGRLVLVDFGIARVFKEDNVKDTSPMGSPMTASPEHYGMAQTDARSDIYTLGATLHYLLSNGRGPEEPFHFAPIRELNPRVSQRLEGVIAKAVRISADERYRSMAEMEQALLNSRTDPLPTLEPLGRERFEEERTERLPQSAGTTSELPGWVSGVIATLIVLLALSVGFAWQSRASSAAIQTSATPLARPTSTRIALRPTPATPEPEPSPATTPRESARIVAQRESVAFQTPTVVKRSTLSAPPVAKQPVPSLGSKPSYPKAAKRPKSFSSEIPQKPPTRAPELTLNPTFPPANNRGAASNSQLVHHPLFDLTVAAEFRQTFSDGGRLVYEAINPPRILEVRVHDLSRRQGPPPYEKRLEILRQQGATDISVSQSGPGLLRLSYKVGGQTGREVLLRWPDRPFAVHFIYRAPHEIFNRYAGELTKTVESLKLR